MDVNPPTAKRSLEASSISNTIENPNTFNTNNYMDQLYYNLWNANNAVVTYNGGYAVNKDYFRRLIADEAVRFLHF